MKVVIVVEKNDMGGGAQKVALMSALGLAERGIDVTIFSGNAQPDDHVVGNSHISNVCIDEPSFWDLPHKHRRLKRLLWSDRAAEELAKLLEKHSYYDTIVHIHTFGQKLTASVVTCALDMCFATILTCHEYSAACPTHVFYNYPDETVCTKRPLSLDCITSQCHQSRTYKLGNVAQKYATKHFLKMQRRLPHAIFLSKLSHDVLRPNFSPRLTAHWLRNPQDLRHLPPADVAANESFVFVGRLVPEKAPALAAEAAKIAGVPIVFCGDGPERTRVLAANPQAEITGWLPAEGVFDRIRAARALVMPSIWYECAPLVAVEAQSQGLPVISSDSCATREAVEEGVTGYTFRSKDVQDLAAKMTLLKDPVHAASLGAAAYEKVWQDPPTTSDHIDKLLEIYRGMLHGE